MPEPLPLPIRVLVKGPSNVGIASGMGGPRSDLTYPRAVEAELFANGRPANVRAITVPGELASSTLRNWEREVIGFSPDVVVIAYGHYEAVHYILPRWLERHANSWRTRPGRYRAAYRRLLLRPVWLLLAQVQAKLDSTFGPAGPKSRPKRVVADVERLVERVRYIHTPLVFLLEVQPPSTRQYQSWFPGMTARIAEVNRELEALVDRLDEPDIRYCRTTDLVAEKANGDLQIAMPDGFHFTPDMHRAIGKKLAAEIMVWADAQEHLKMHD